MQLQKREQYYKPQDEELQKQLQVNYIKAVSDGKDMQDLLESKDLKINFAISHLQVFGGLI